MAEVENQRLVIMPLLAKFNVYPKLYPCIAGCIVDSDIGNAICRAEDLPSGDNKSLPQVDTTAQSGGQSELSRVLHSLQGFALIGWILMIVLLCQLSYAIKTQLNAPKTPTLD